MQSPVEYVRALPPEEKEAVLAELIREAIQINGGQGLISIQAPSGESLGYYVPPAVAEQALKRVGIMLSDEDRERTRDALANPDQTFDMTTFLEELREEEVGKR